MKLSKFFLWTSLVVCTLLFTSCTNSDGDTLENTPINVEVQQVQKYDLKESITYSGTIEESESLPLSFLVMGTVLKINVNEGEFVKKGQLLAALNDQSAKNAYQISLASLTQAQDAYNRLKPMYDNGNLPEIKFVEVKSTLQQAKAEVAIAEKNMNDCYLYATEDGYVGTRSIDQGMNVAPGIPAINIVQITTVSANVSVSESEISSIKKGQKAIITISALENKEFEGKVEEIGVMADPIGHTYKVKIDINNKDGVIKPGMICDVVIAKPTDFDGLIIKNEAIMVDENGRKFVYAVDKEKNRVYIKYIVPGRIMKYGLEIKEGLATGDEVVVAGQQKLVDNSLVNIVNRSR